jgi:hypothetical protein
MVAPPSSGQVNLLITIPLIRQQNGWGMAPSGYG